MEYEIEKCRITFLATKRTIIKEAAKHPAAILAAIRLVDASIKTMPQNDDPKSVKKDLSLPHWHDETKNNQQMLLGLGRRRNITSGW